MKSGGGRYVSSSDVEVAIKLHPRFEGNYDSFNMSKKLAEPNSQRRLEKINEAFKHRSKSERHQPFGSPGSAYKSKEL